MNFHIKIMHEPWYKISLDFFRVFGDFYNLSLFSNVGTGLIHSSRMNSRNIIGRNPSMVIPVCQSRFDAYAALGIAMSSSFLDEVGPTLYRKNWA